MLAFALGGVAAALGDTLFAVSRAPRFALSTRGTLALFEHATALWLLPAVLLGVAAELFVASAWRQPRLLAAFRWLAAGPRTWFRRDADAAVATALAALFAIVTLGPVFPVALFVGTSFHSRPLASLAIFLAVVVAAVGGALFALLLAAPLAWFFRRAPALASPGAVVVAALLALAVPVARVAARLRPTVRGLDPAVWSLPIVLLGVACVAAWAVTRTRPGSYRAAAWLIALSGLGLPALSVATLGRSPVVAHVLGHDAPMAGAVVTALRQASDRDGDGYGTLAGGGDCNDHDRAVHPGAIDVPGNHRDEDCSGRDARPRTPPDEPRADAVARIAGARPSIVLVTVDGMPATGCGTAPRADLAGFNAGAACFSRAYSPADRVGFAIAALLTGRTASELPWSATGGAATLASDAVTAPARLLALGYETASFSTDPSLLAHAGLRRGFVATFDGHGYARDAAEIARHAATFLEDRAHDRHPALLHVHFGLYDPRTAPSIAAVVAGAQALGRSQPVVIVLTGAAAHAASAHLEGGTLREASLRIPLWIHGPNIRAGERRAPCSLVDLAPTFFDLVGSPSPWITEGRSLVPLLSTTPDAHPEPPRAVIAEGFDGDDALRATRIAWLAGGFELIAAPAQDDWALYDLARDPAQRSNRFDPWTEPSWSLREAVASYVPYAQHLAARLGELRLDARPTATPVRGKQRLDARFADALELTSVEPMPATVAPGDVLRIAIEYRTLARSRTPLWLAVTFTPATPGAGSLPTIRRWPLEGRDPTDGWNVGETRCEVLQLVVPRDARPGTSTARFSVRADPDLSPVRPPTGADRDGSVALGTVTVVAARGGSPGP